MENIKCDKCNKEFSLEVRDINTKAIDDIQVSYFECKHCNHKYITTCVDNYIIKEQRRYQNIFKEIQELIRITVRSDKTNITQYDKKLEALKDKKLKCLENMKLHSNILKEKIKNRVI